MVLGSTQPLTGMSTPGVFPGGKGGRCVRLTILPPSCTSSWNLRTLTSWNPLGHTRPVMGLLYLIYSVSQEEWQNFGRVFRMLNYTDIIQNTYIQSWTFTEIMAIEKSGLLGCPRTVRRPWRHTHPLRMPGKETPLANVAMQWPWRDYASAAACVKCLVTLRTTMTWVRVFS